MSKIANRIIRIPTDVSVNFDSSVLTIKGPNANFELPIPTEVNIKLSDNSLSTELFPDGQSIAIVGTFNSIIASLIKGSKEDFKKSLAIRGVGYRAEISDRLITLHLGYSHPIKVVMPDGLSAKYSASILTISGANKQEVGLFAAKIRKFRLPNVFVKSLKGVFYHDLGTGKDEKIVLKSGKRDSK